MNKPIYHTSRLFVYLDNGDGSLSVFHRKSGHLHDAPRTIAWVKNDEQGRAYIKLLRHLASARTRAFNYLYRCPKEGTYKSNTGGHSWSNRGHIPKDKALVISVRA